MDTVGEGNAEVAYARRKKPPELLQLYQVTATLFTTLKEIFNVPESYEFSLRHVDDAAHHRSNPIGAVALAMLKVQDLRLIARPDIVTVSDVVVGIAAELTRTLEELAGSLDVQEISWTLRQTRDQINEAGRIVADLGHGTDEGIVELC